MRFYWRTDGNRPTPKPYVAAWVVLGPTAAPLAGFGATGFALVFWYGVRRAAFHRIVERGDDTERLHRFSSVMVLSAMAPLALRIAGDF